MREGFSLVELIIALLLLQVGLLSTAGLVLLAQRNMVRARLTLRAVTEGEWVADSLVEAGARSPGSLPRPWGEISWIPGPEGLGEVMVMAMGPGTRDTLAVLLSFPPPPSSLLIRVDSGVPGGSQND
jgi:hypothetical protein